MTMKTLKMSRRRKGLYRRRVSREKKLRCVGERGISQDLQPWFRWNELGRRVEETDTWSFRGRRQRNSVDGTAEEEKISGRLKVFNLIFKNMNSEVKVRTEIRGNANSSADRIGLGVESRKVGKLLEPGVKSVRVEILAEKAHIVKLRTKDWGRQSVNSFAADIMEMEEASERSGEGCKEK